MHSDFNNTVTLVFFLIEMYPVWIIRESVSSLVVEITNIMLYFWITVPYSCRQLSSVRHSNQVSRRCSYSSCCVDFYSTEIFVRC